jgi:hypothetical protein
MQIEQTDLVKDTGCQIVGKQKAEKKPSYIFFPETCLQLTVERQRGKG